MTNYYEFSHLVSNINIFLIRIFGIIVYLYQPKTWFSWRIFSWITNYHILSFYRLHELSLLFVHDYRVYHVIVTFVGVTCWLWYFESNRCRSSPLCTIRNQCSLDFPSSPNHKRTNCHHRNPDNWEVLRYHPESFNLFYL